MSFLKRLFGLGGNDGGEAAAAQAGPTLEHLGYQIRATPYRDGGQYQLCGVISKEVDGVMKEHRFVRADRFSDVDTAAEMTLVKARLIISERGDRMFD